MGEARSLSHQHFYIRSVGYGEIIENSSKNDTEAIPIRCRLFDSFIAREQRHRTHRSCRKKL